MKTLLVLLFIPSVCYTQYSISPILGIDFMQLHSIGYDGPESLNIPDNGFENGSIVLGLEIGYRLSDEFKISTNASFTNKQYDATREANFFGVERIKFDYLTGEVNIRYLFSNIYVSAGYEMGFINKMQYKYQTDGLNVNTNLGGLLFGTGIYFKRFSVNAYYFTGLNDVEIDSFILLAPIKSIGVYIAYELIKTEKSNVKVKCPRV